MFIWALTFTYVMEVQIPCKRENETYCVLRTEEDRQERFENKKEAVDFMKSCPDALYVGEGCKNWKLERIK